MNHPFAVGWAFGVVTSVAVAVIMVKAMKPVTVRLVGGIVSTGVDVALNRLAP